MKTAKLSKKILKSALEGLNNEQYIDIYRKASCHMNDREEFELLSAHYGIYTLHSNKDHGTVYMSESMLRYHLRSYENSMIDFMIRNGTDFGLLDGGSASIQAA